MLNNLLIIGCGLIGSSVLRASLSKKIAKKIFIYERSKKNREIIKKINSKIIILKRIDNNIRNINFIIICTPMSEYKKVFSQINIFISKSTIITEVGSTKKNLLKYNSRNIVLSHPIAGSEVSGPKYGHKDLFKNKWCILIKKTNIKNLNVVKKFWSKLGSKIVIMNADEHDKIFSITSHLPHLIAYNLIKTAQDFQKKERKNVIKYSAGGLRDFSRTAASNEVMWRDIFFSNKKNLIISIDLFIKNLSLFKKNIKLYKNLNLIKDLKNAKKVRNQIIRLKQDVSKPDFGRVIK